MALQTTFKAWGLGLSIAVGILVFLLVPAVGSSGTLLVVVVVVAGVAHGAYKI
jgi:hypothetical protein